MYLISDIDECTDTAGICGSGTCTNNDGSYTCTCNSGYEVVTDGTTCTGNDTMGLFDFYYVKAVLEKALLVSYISWISDINECNILLLD